MVFHGLSRALSRTPNISDALSYANKDADFSVVEGLNAPLLSALIDARISAGLPPAVLAVTATNREAERLAALELQAESGEEVELEEGESLDDLKARMGKLKPKKASIPADLLNNANSYDDKVALIRMIVSDNSGRVASVMRNMIES